MTNSDVGGKTMGALDRRLDKLEQTMEPESSVVVRPSPGESDEQCLRRHGHWPPNPGTLYTFMHIRFVAPGDASVAPQGVLQ